MQYPPPNNKTGKSPPLVAAAKGLATTASWLSVFVASPLLHRLVDPAVRTFTEREYGADLCDLASLGALILVGCLSYFVTSLIATAILIPAALKLSAKTFF